MRVAEVLARFLFLCSDLPAQRLRDFDGLMAVCEPVEPGGSGGKCSVTLIEHLKRVGSLATSLMVELLPTLVRAGPRGTV